MEDPMIIPDILENELSGNAPTEKTQSTSSVTKLNVLDPVDGNVFLTKTKPDNSVILYTAGSFANSKIKDTSSDNPENVHVTVLYSDKPNKTVDSSTFTTLLEVHEDMFAGTNQTSKSPIVIDIDDIKSKQPDSTSDSSDASKENEIFHTTSRSSDSFSKMDSETSTQQPLLIWTLSPLPSILNAKPSKLAVMASSTAGFPTISQQHFGISAFMTVPKFTADQTTPLSSETSTEKSHTETTNEISDSGNTPSYLVRATLTSTAKPPMTTNWLDAYNVNSSDPFAIWTTTRPARRPVLQPRPSAMDVPTTTEKLSFWTTKKPGLIPRPSVEPASTTDAEPVTKLILPSLLSPMKPAIDDSDDLLDDLIASMSHSLLKNEGNSSVDIDTTETPSDSWATSTYAIWPLDINVAENTIDVDSPNIKQSSSSTAPDEVTTSAPEITTMSTVQTSSSTGDTLTIPTLETTTDSNISGTTPIDLFIENLLNSLMLSNSSTAPPIDLDLLQQVK